MRSALCIDIGGTRIKAAILSECIDLETLKVHSPCVIRTLGWLNHSLPEIISPNNWASVVRQESLADPCTEIAIDVPGPVDNGRFLRSDLSVPVDLRDAFGKYAHDKRITLVKDADAWIVGATAYLDLVEDAVEYPALALIFGTAIGFAGARNRNTFDSYEISRWASRFPCLAVAANRSIGKQSDVHMILGKDFFEWVDRKNKGWTFEHIRDEFTKRVVALVKDLTPGLAQSIIRPRTLIIGGGNAEFVSARTLEDRTGVTVKSLCSRRIRVNPDLIPLLGLNKLVFGSNRFHLPEEPAGCLRRTTK